MTYGLVALPYAPCTCGHCYDHHTDPGDPRKVGCWRCECKEYVAVSKTVDATSDQRLTLTSEIQ